MLKRQYNIEEFSFLNGEIDIIFYLSEDEQHRNIIIDEFDFKKYVDKSGYLNYFTDEWDGYKESHYTKEHKIIYEEWVEKELEKQHLEDYLYQKLNHKSLPKVTEE